jgi:dTDP-4-dehydrorhamnose reductase
MKGATNMNALIIGGGHLGTFLKERLNPKYHYTGIMNYLTQEMLDDMNVKVVINTAGKTSLEMCEKSPYQAFDCNVIQPLRLLRMIKDQIFIQFSSGCIWDGPYDELGHPFMVGSLATPACFYSWTKVSCEALMQREALGKKLVILRPRQVYSPLPSPRNTLTKLRTYEKLIDTPNSMTSAETIAKTIEFLAEDEVCFPITMNVFDKGVTSPYRVGMIMHELGLREKPVLLTKGDLDVFLKPKRVDAVLSDDFFCFEVDPPHVECELRRVIVEYSKRI